MALLVRAGRGKARLIRCVNLFERPTSGSVCIDGQDLTQLAPRSLRALRRQMGMVFQHFNLLSHRTVMDNVGFPLELIGKDRATIRARNLAFIRAGGFA